MASLKKTLKQLREELLSDDEPIEELESVTLIIDDLMDLGKLSEAPQSQIPKLQQSEISLFQAAVFCQTVWDLYSDMAFDGLLSVFYNRTGAEIDGLREILRNGDGVMFNAAETAYFAVAPEFGIEPQSNWVERNRDKDPRGSLSQASAELVSAIERQLEEIQADVYLGALERARKAAEI